MPFSINSKNKWCITVESYTPDPRETRIVIPEGVHNIGPGVFENSESIKEVILPESIRFIRSKAFKNCVNLENIIFNGNPDIVSIEDDAFEGCQKIFKNDEFVKLGNMLCKYKGESEDIIIPEGIQIIGKRVFREFLHYENGRPIYKVNKIKSVKFPESLKYIDEEAFEGCTELQEVTIPANVIVIGKGAFAKCISLEKVNFTGKLKTIDCDAFGGCIKLKYIEFSDKLKEIGRSAFAYCKSLECVKLPQSLKRINITAFEKTNLKSIYLQNEIEVDKYDFEINAPYYIFPNAKLNKKTSYSTMMHMTLSYCSAPEKYDDTQAEKYHEFIFYNYEKVKEIAQKKGINIDVIYSQIKSKYGNEIERTEQIILNNGEKYIPQDLSRIGRDIDDFPTVEEIKEYLKEYFYLYSFEGHEYAACYGRYSMSLILLILEGILKPKEFHENIMEYGGWSSVMFEGEGIEDARTYSGFNKIINLFIAHGIVYKTTIKNRVIFVIKDYHRYINKKENLPKELRDKADKIIDNQLMKDF